MFVRMRIGVSSPLGKGRDLCFTPGEKPQEAKAIQTNSG